MKRGTHIPRELAEFGERLAQCFEEFSESIEVQNLAQLVTEGEPFYSIRFDIDVATIRQLIAVLTADEHLWTDFERAVQAHRKSTHCTVLLEHFLAVGKLQGRLKILEQALACPAIEERRRLAKQLNAIDGNVALCRELADRRDLAARINADADFPVIDGLSLRFLTYVLGERPELWLDFQTLAWGTWSVARRPKKRFDE